MSPISEEMVNDAQQAWCDGLVRIGDVAAERGDVRTSAGDLVDALYDYAQGMVFFKPTLAYGRTAFAGPGAVRSPTSSEAIQTSWRTQVLR